MLRERTRHVGTDFLTVNQRMRESNLDRAGSIVSRKIRRKDMPIQDVVAKRWWGKAFASLKINSAEVTQDVLL